MSCMQAVIKEIDGEVIAVDGKKARVIVKTSGIRSTW